MEAQNRNYHSKKYTARARHFFSGLKLQWVLLLTDIEFMNISDSNPNEKPRGLCVNIMKYVHSRNIKEYLLMQ